jgi:hypothetical protein
VYVDATEGWKNVQDSTSNVTGNAYITATGGTITHTCGDYKIHTFKWWRTADGKCFSVSLTVSVQSYPITVGAGGSAANGPAGRSASGSVSQEDLVQLPQVYQVQEEQGQQQVLMEHPQQELVEVQVVQVHVDHQVQQELEVVVQVGLVVLLIMVLLEQQILVEEEAEVLMVLLQMVIQVVQESLL